MLYYNEHNRVVEVMILFQICRNEFGLPQLKFEAQNLITNHY